MGIFEDALGQQKCAFCGKKIKGIGYNIGGDSACEKCHEYYMRKFTE